MKIKSVSDVMPVWYVPLRID